MPYGDRTGPLGRGPKTGRAAGFCAGYDMPGSENYAFGRGMGRAGGRGRRFGSARFGRFDRTNGQSISELSASCDELRNTLEALEAEISILRSNRE
ncbi:MAG: DUF5320 domain-containing protein [Phycisphaerae bacterium]|jgi:hypothetical protein